MRVFELQRNRHTKKEREKDSEIFECFFHFIHCVQLTEQTHTRTRRHTEILNYTYLVNCIFSLCPSASRIPAFVAGYYRFGYSMCAQSTIFNRFHAIDQTCFHFGSTNLKPLFNFMNFFVPRERRKPYCGAHGILLTV